MPTITFERTAPGHFQAYENGSPVPYEIINGSLGVSGHGRNVYGIVNTLTKTVKWIGSLASAKKVVELSLRKTGR